MKRRLGSILLSFAMLLTLLPSLVAPAQAAGYTWPVPGHTRLSQEYHSGHQAIDISDGSINGADIVAAMGGTVYVKHTCPDQHYGSMGDCGGFGNGLVIAGDDGRYYSYGHMLNGSIPSNVYKGAYVSTGQKIGRVGTTGNSSGPHLHFAVANNSRYWENCINPMNLFNGGSTTAGVTFAFPTNEGYASKYQVWEKNAVLVSQVSATSGTMSNVTKVGIYLYDDAGKQLATKSETPVAAFTNASTSYMWYDINGELGYTLTPGTKYQYKFYAISGGKTYTSETYTFTTKGSKPTTEPEPITGTEVTCARKLTIPANKKLVCYNSARDTTPSSRYMEAKDQAYTLWCDAYLVSNGKILRYKFTSGNGHTLWFAAKDASAATFIHTYGSEKFEETHPHKGYKLCDCGQKTYTGNNRTVDQCANCIPAATTFSDVNPTDYFSQPVAWAVSHHITTGTGNGKFSPNWTCTRAQIITFLWRSIGQPTPASGTQGFADVPTDAYYYDATRWARSMGMADGSYFYPDSDCTRAMAVTFMYQFAGSPSMRAPTQFTDVPSNAHYAPAVQWALDRGVTNGTSATTFSPNQTCTRGQIVTFLFRGI